MKNEELLDAAADFYRWSDFYDGMSYTLFYYLIFLVIAILAFTAASGFAVEKSTRGKKTRRRTFIIPGALVAFVSLLYFGVFFGSAYAKTESEEDYKTEAQLAVVEEFSAQSPRVEIPAWSFDRSTDYSYRFLYYDNDEPERYEVDLNAATGNLTRNLVVNSED